MALTTGDLLKINVPTNTIVGQPEGLTVTLMLTR